MIQDFAPAIPSAPTNTPLTTTNGDTHQAWQSFFDGLGQYISSSTWQIGDYRQSALAVTALGAQWLACDGTELQTLAYPALSAVLLPITGQGADGAGTFLLPDIAPVYRESNQSVPYLTTYIRAM